MYTHASEGGGRERSNQSRALKLDATSAPEDSLRGEPARASEGGAQRSL